MSIDDKVVPHPKRGLMAEAMIERELSDSSEAEALQQGIFEAVRAYVDFLHDHNIIWEDGPDPDGVPRLKARALVVTVDFGTDPLGDFDITLKDGALDRVYGDGINPDPSGFDADPTRLLDLPHK
jgi:hypothetical protein